MATNSNRLQSVVKFVSKPPVQPFNKLQARKQPSSRDPQPSKIESLEDSISHLSNDERLRFELERFGHFTIEEGGRWTQAEIDAERARQIAAKEAGAPSTQRSLAFVLNLDFNPAPEPQYIIVNDDPQPVPTNTAKPFIPSALCQLLG